MARPKLRRADQPVWLQVLLGVYEFLASLKLAVVLIASAAFSLGWATFVESGYGTPAVQFGVYGTWWFAAINLLLAVNIFCAAAIRFPWKKYQTGFVITHVGLLTLLFGCLLSRRGGIDAQMPLFEDSMGHIAYEDSHHITLTVSRAGGKHESIVIPFRAGPFNWSDYDDVLFQPFEQPPDEPAVLRKVRSGFAHVSGALFRLPQRDQGFVYDKDGIRVEVLDYYSDSVWSDVPLLTMKMSLPRMKRPGKDGKIVEEAETWMPVRTLAATSLADHMRHGEGEPNAVEQVGGGNLTFLAARNAAAVDAFLHSRPQGKLGSKGQIVLYAAGKPLYLDVEEKLNKGKVPLPGTDLQVEVSDFHTFGDSIAVVRVSVFRGDQAVGKLALIAEAPWMSAQDTANNIFGTYWFDHGDKTTEERMAGAGGSRIDILAGPDRKLYYRYWNGREVVTIAPLPTDGTPVNAFKMPIAQLKMAVDQYIAADETLPLKFQKDKQGKRVAARMRVTVDGNAETFWLAGAIPSPAEQKPTSAEQKRVHGKNRIVTVMLPPDQVDVGFRIRLDDFDRKLDPGTSQPSHYTSVVDFVDPKDDDKTLQSDVVITMNAPVDFSDPTSGRSYRLFQESFSGPFAPGGEGEALYYRYAKGDRSELFSSTLTVNYDPGRGIKYAGSLLIVAGIATMFYMRAYFFKPTAPRKQPPVKRQRPIPEPVA